MDRRPVPPEKRRVLEALIRVIDLVIYFAVAVGGVYALIAPPMSVQTELTGWEWMIPLWGVLFLLGGVGGFVGRLSRFWIVEVPALPLAAFGIGLYFVILIPTAFASVFAAVATSLVLAALLNVVRRYLELQIFATEPDDRNVRARLLAAALRRTRDAVPRDE